MRTPGGRSGRAARHAAALVCAALAVSAVLAGCTVDGGGGRTASAASRRPAQEPPRPSDAQRHRVPGVGDRLHSRIPASTRQVVAVYGEGEHSADSTAVLYAREGDTWSRERAWPAHNGKRGWTTRHREGDRRSPVGVFTLSDAGGVLPDPGAKLPYTRSDAFAAPRSWPRTHWHDFDHVIAVDYNRVRGTPPNDPTRPWGRARGGGIWLHLDHGSGTSGCVGLPRPAMEHLLRTLDPAHHPVVVMGDREHLAG